MRSVITTGTPDTDSPRLEPFRELFGDERAEYQQPCNATIRMGRANWEVEFISAYATCHPWEDWANRGRTSCT